MPRTEHRRKRAVRFCGKCGYELTLGNDGICPMCPRLSQLRRDFTTPKPDSAQHSRPSPETAPSPGPNEWPPTVDEYRAILAKRRARSASPAQGLGSVVRTPGLTRSNAPGDKGAAPIAAGQLPAPAPLTPKRQPLAAHAKPKGRKKDVGRPAARPAARRAAQVPARLTPAAHEEPGPPAVAMTPHAPPRPPGASHPAPRVQGLTEWPSKRRGAPDPPRNLLRFLLALAVVVVSALVGFAVPTLLSLSSR